MALVRHPKKLVRPGQWVLAKVPDYLKQNSYDFEDRDKVYICIVPEYGPIHDSESGFRWWYYINWRFPHTEPQEGKRYKWYWSHSIQYRVKDKTEDGKWSDGHYRYMIHYDFGLIEYGMGDHRTSGQEWDDEEGRRRYKDGKGGFLYEPASDDPEECPGGDYSIYYCDQCEKYVTPWSNDDGDLVCPHCSNLSGIICDRKTAEQIERAELASFVGPECRARFESCLNHLGHPQSFDRPGRCLLYPEDKFSFNFMLQVHAEGKWNNLYNGGLIKHGPHCEIQEDGSYIFRLWDYEHKQERDATDTEIHTHISWSTHT